MHADEAGDEVVARSAMTKASWRLLPLIGLGYLIAIMDRGNISFASLQMNVELGFSAAVYGLGAGIFFVGFSLFEIPSNLLCARVGPRRWLARIMLTWGLISAGMMFVRTPTQFYIMRFLLGVAEAGFFPGVMLYLSALFPSAWRGRAVSRVYIAAPAGAIVTGGLAGWLLGLGGLLHLAGWQWLFLAEGLPAVVLAVALLVLLPDSPHAAAWLSDREKAWLSRTLAADVATSGASHDGFLRSLLDPMVLAIGSVLALTFACSNAIGYSAPKLLVEATGWTITNVGFLIAFGGVTATVVTLFVGWRSDDRKERYLHLAAVIGLTAVSAAALALASGPLPTVLAYLFFVTAAPSVAMVSNVILTVAVHPASRPVSFAAATTVAGVGAFVGPWLWGIAADRTHSFKFGLEVVPFVLLAVILIVLAMRRRAANATAATVGAGAV